MSWTTPADIRATIERRWSRGDLLRPAGLEQMFPLAIRLSRPSASELSTRFDEVRRWIRTLDEGSRANIGTGYEIQWAEVNHRQLGSNRLPAGIVVPTREDALALIGKRRAGERFAAINAQTLAELPTLANWVTRQPLAALEHADEWSRVLAVVRWFVEHPSAAIYMRQIDLPGIDSKFIERHRALIANLLDEVLPPEVIDRALSPTRQFEGRYGLRSKPTMVRFRILDPRLAIGGLTDIATPAEDFARLDLSASRVFITENEINGLAFPPLSHSIVVFGLGYGLERLSECGWMRQSSVHYWGDIDTHGFSMLDRLRASFPAARSLLMDQETLLAHRPFWGHEPEPHRLPLTRLAADERIVYEALLAGELGDRVRLEQERIAFSWVKAALDQLT